MIPYGRQFIDQKDKAAVAEVLGSDWLTQGPKIVKFEEALADYCGTKYAVAVSNGTTALHLAYLASGLKKGDEVITTPNTFVATSNMLLVMGVKPVYCDIRLDTYIIDESKIEKLITKKTKAIVPVDFAGHPCEYKKIKAIAKKHNLKLIVDACPSISGEYQGKRIGSLADMTVFSFHAVKPITTGEGGAITTDDEKIYKKLLLLRSHGITKDSRGFNVMTELGYNYRLTEMQAALGITQIKKLDRFLKTRRQIVKWYQAALAKNINIVLPKEIKGSSSAWHLYVVRTKEVKDRLPLYNFLKNNGVGVNFHYPSVFSHPYYQKRGFTGKGCNNAKLYDDTAITLPLHTHLKQSQIKFISSLINEYFKNDQV